MSNKPIDDALDFDPAKIEQMEVEFDTCPHCGGEGIRNNGLYAFNCPVCFGTGSVEKEEGLNEKIFALESQLHKAEADNAALLKIVKEYYSKAMWEYHREMSAAGLKDTFLELQEIIDSPHPGAALLERLQQTEKALMKICLDIAEDCCPCEFYGVKWEKCDTCTHDHEIHADADRDINCWLEYYLQQAKEV